MVGDGCAVVVGYGAPAFGVNEVADEGGVEYKRLRTDFVAGHAHRERGDFGSGEGGVPNTQIRCKDVSK